MCVICQLHALFYYVAVMGKNIKNKDRVTGLVPLRGAVDKSYKMRTEKKKKKKLPYMLIEHMKDLLGANYTK